MAPHHKGNEIDNKACIMAFAKEIGKKVVIQLIDNEPVYFQAFSNLIAQDKELAESLELHTAETSDAAISLASQNNPTLIVCDYDMGKNSANGLEITTRLRKNGNRAFICIHSGINFSKNEVRAAGADYFLPKPMVIRELVALAVLAIKYHRSQGGKESNQHSTARA